MSTETPRFDPKKQGVETAMTIFPWEVRVGDKIVVAGSERSVIELSASMTLQSDLDTPPRRPGYLLAYDLVFEIYVHGDWSLTVPGSAKINVKRDENKAALIDDRRTTAEIINDSFVGLQRAGEMLTNPRAGFGGNAARGDEL